MRRAIRSALVGVLGIAVYCGPVWSAPDTVLVDRLEMLDWTDPERAAQWVDRLAPDERRSPDVGLLEVRGMVYADMHRDADVDAVVARLQAAAAAGGAGKAAGAGRAGSGAALAARYVRAYALYQRSQYADARDALGATDLDAIESPTERYRVAILRGNVLRMVGSAEAALPFLERALDLAQEHHDEMRTLHARLWLARIFLNTENLDRAAEQLALAQQLAMSLGDEAAQVEVEGCLSDVADRRGDPGAERRASLAALEHAKRAGSNKWLAHALVNLGDSYLKSRDFAESLKYSKEALPMVQRLREKHEEPIVLFNEGLAYIGLGDIKPGERLAEEAIAQVLAGSNLFDTKELLREYADALEHAGYLMMAIQAYHRYDDVSEKLMNGARQRVFLELSAKFDDERRARELELLRRDNALNASEMRGQRLQQQLLAAAACFVLCICAALVWAFARVRRANDRLRFNSERDALTGLRNRRFFNEHVLAVDGGRPVSGCVMLADLDHFKRVNDTLGHPAGDAVLAAMSHRLSAALRASDNLVRWGGEEFLAILDPITAEQADETVERLLHAVRRDPVLWKGQAVECTISIGYACFPMAGSAAGISLDSAISLVDKALYEAKRRGRDRACLISAMNANDERDLTIISAEFERAAADARIRLVETGAAA